MAIYKYKYIKEGKKVEETKNFSDKGAVYAAVRQSGGSLLSLEEISGKKSSFKFLRLSAKIKNEDKITFAKNLAVMIDAGLSISRALAILEKQSKNKKLVTILKSVNESVSSGETLSESLEKHPETFSSLFVSMVKAGEESGKLSLSLKTVAEELEKSNTLSKKVKGAMIYPGIIVSIMIVIGIVLMIYMVPTLTETFKGLNIILPLPTRIIITISDFLRTNVLLTFLVLILVGVGGVAILRTKKGKDGLDWLVSHLPVIKTLSSEVNAARTTRTLSSLISSGVDIVSALRITSQVVQNHYYKDVLERSAKNVETGEVLSASLASTNIYPVFVGEMLAVGEETGKMTDMLQNIAVYYESEVDQKTKDLSTVIEPFLMVLIGVAVGIFAIAMMLPTYSLVDAIK